MSQSIIPAICATIHGLVILLLMPLGWTLFAWALYYGGIYRFLALVYLVHMFFNLRDRERGGYNHPYILTSYYYNKVREHYGIRLKALGEYQPDKNYVLGIHPHGLLAIGVVATNDQYSKDFREIFGNEARVKFATSTYNTVSPLTKDYFFGLNAISASEESMTFWLNRPEGGHILILVVGGAAESNLMAANEYRLLLRKRKGFCRIAFQTGTHLIPSFTFGEMEIYPVIKATGFFVKMQNAFTSTFGVGLPLVTSIIPRKQQVTVVLGKPIEVEKTLSPTREQVNELHAKYIEGVQTVFDSQKHKYYPNKKVELQFE